MKEEFELVGKSISASEKIYRESTTYWKDAYRRIKKNRAAMVSFWFLSILIVFAIVGPLLGKTSNSEMALELKNQFGMESVKAGFYFGLDNFGRDFFTRVWEGARISLAIAFIVVIIEGIIGTFYGGIAGYIGGKTDMVMMRTVEVFMAVPSMIYIILLMVVIGPGMHTIIIAMSITRWMYMAMIVRGEVLKLKKQEYIMASISLGASPLRVIVKHLIPNAMGQIIVALTLDIPQAIFTEAFLSFIGIGIPIPLASWGSLANDGFEMVAEAPHLFIIPAILISITTLSFNIFGDGLRDALDPKLRK